MGASPLCSFSLSMTLGFSCIPRAIEALVALVIESVCVFLSSRVSFFVFVCIVALCPANFSAADLLFIPSSVLSFLSSIALSFKYCLMLIVLTSPDLAATSAFASLAVVSFSIFIFPLVPGAVSPAK